MKALVLATAATLALSGAASAMTAHDAVLQAEVDTYVQGVDLSALTDAQINAIELSVYSGDSAAEVRSFIKSVVGG